MRSHERNYDANIEAKICIAMDFLFNLYMFNSNTTKISERYERGLHYPIFNVFTLIVRKITVVIQK